MLRLPPFTYEPARTRDEAVSLLARHGAAALPVPGGTDLYANRKQRLFAPQVVVGLRPIQELHFIRYDDTGGLTLGALATLSDVAESEVVNARYPALAHAARQISTPQLRNMGTIGGVMAHADAAGDYPTLALMLDAEIVTNKGRHPAHTFFQDLFTTPLAHDELICEVAFPIESGPHRYLKFRRRLFDWAIVAAAAQKTAQGWRLGPTNVGTTPVRALAVEQALGQGAGPAEAAEHASDGLNPSGDIRATPDYKKHLARVLTRRAIEQAEGAPA